MDEKLKRYIEYFKKYTIEMIKDLENDDLENFEVALNNRQQIIDKINDLKFNQSEFKKICEQLDIITLDNELNKIIKHAKDNVKKKILELKKSQSVNTAYYSNINNSNVFSKKV